MPDPARHLGQCRHNLKLLKEPPFCSQEKEYSDWFITICYYAAVHLIDLKLAEILGKNGDPSDHLSREGYIDRILEPRYKGIAQHYHALKIMSRKARYYCLSNNELNTVYAMTLFTRIATLLNIQP